MQHSDKTEAHVVLWSILRLDFSGNNFFFICFWYNCKYTHLGVLNFWCYLFKQNTFMFSNVIMCRESCYSNIQEKVAGSLYFGCSLWTTSEEIIPATKARWILFGPWFSCFSLICRLYFTCFKINLCTIHWNVKIMVFIMRTLKL